MRRNHNCELFVSIRFLSGAPAAGTSSEGKPDVVTATVRVLRDGQLKALATLCTSKHALTIANDFIYTQEKYNTVKVTVIAGDFSESGMCSSHLVKKIITDKSTVIIVLAIIFVSCRQTPRP